VLQTATTTRLGHEHERAGYDAIFEKPYKIAEVVETVGQLLGRKRRATKGGRGGVGP